MNLKYYHSINNTCGCGCELRDTSESGIKHFFLIVLQNVGKWVMSCTFLKVVLLLTESNNFYVLLCIFSPKLTFSLIPRSDSEILDQCSSKFLL